MQLQSQIVNEVTEKQINANRISNWDKFEGDIILVVNVSSQLIIFDVWNWKVISVSELNHCFSVSKVNVNFKTSEALTEHL